VNICILTTDIVGPVKNGGIGSAFYFLAKHLVQTHTVTIAFLPTFTIENDQISFWVRFYKTAGLTLDVIQSNSENFIGTPGAVRSYAAYEYLVEQNFDVVHFPDYMGIAYYPLLAKKGSFFFDKTQFVGHLHGNTKWHLEGSYAHSKTLEEIENQYLEEQSIKMADLVISPSEYMLSWAKKAGWLDAQPCLVIGHASVPADDFKVSTVDHFSGIAFVGRLEVRKGILDFVEAVKLLPGSIPAVFIGKSDTIENQNSVDFIRQLFQSQNREISFRLECNYFDTQKIIRSKGILVVVPSLLENSPCIIHECLTAGTPFIARDTGGVIELLSDTSNSPNIYSGNALELVKKLIQSQESISNYVAAASTKLKTADTEWTLLHHDLEKILKNQNHFQSKFGQNSSPLVSICIATKDRPSLLVRALSSLVNQSYQNIEIIIMDDGSTANNFELVDACTKNIKTNVKIQLVSGTSVGPGPARNFAASLAKGNLFVFFDDDNIAKPKFVEKLVQAYFKFNCHFVTCPFDIFDRTEENPKPKKWIPLGAERNLGLHFNVFGDTASLVEANAFREVGGFSSDCILNEDWDLFYKLNEKGFKHGMVPESLFEYERHSSNRSIVDKHSSATFLIQKKLLSYAPPKYRDSIALSLSIRSRVFATTFYGNQPIIGDAPEVALTNTLFNIYRNITNLHNLCCDYVFGGVEILTTDSDPYFVFHVEKASELRRITLNIFCVESGFLQMFYLERGESEFKSSNFIEKPFSSGENQIHFELPFGIRYDCFRIDFPERISKYFLSDLQFFGTKNQQKEHSFEKELSYVKNSKLYAYKELTFLPSDLVNTEILNDGTYRSSSPDSQILLSGFRFDAPSMYLVFSMTVDRVSQFEFFYSFSSEESFSEDKKLSLLLQSGENVFRIACFSKVSIEKIRIDPVNANGINFQLQIETERKIVCE